MFKKTDLRALFHVEAALIYSSFYFVEKAEGHVAKAAAAAGMKLSETGAMGRRTKFQGSLLNASFLKFNYQLGCTVAACSISPKAGGTFKNVLQNITTERTQCTPRFFLQRKWALQEDSHHILFSIADSDWHLTFQPKRPYKLPAG